MVMYLDDEERKKFFEESYKNKECVKTFDNTRMGKEYQRMRHRFQAKTISEKIPGKSAKVLEVGVGTARFPIDICKEKKCFFVGIDPSIPMLRESKKKLESYELDKKILLAGADGFSLPFKDKTFDVVYSIHVFIHLNKTRQRKLFRKMLRVTRPGGYVIFDTINNKLTQKYDKLRKMFKKKVDRPDNIMVDMKDVNYITSGAPGEIENISGIFIAPFDKSKIFGNRLFVKIISIMNSVFKNQEIFLPLFHSWYVKFRRN